MSFVRDRRNSFFSVAIDLIVTDCNLPYDLYINSSVIIAKERFVRIFPRDGRLTSEDIKNFKKKYHQLYVLESQRDDYLRSLIHLTNVSDTKKTEIIKDSAILYLNKVFDKEKEFTTEVLGETILGCRESVESMVDVIQDYEIGQVRELIGNLSFHDFYTYDHSINVSMYNIAIMKALKPDASRDDLVVAGLGGLLHDLGKIKIPTTIINNPGQLSEADFAVIKKHPGFGEELLGETMEHNLCDCPGVDFEIIKRVILEHHENWNGTGYPNQVKGADIHLFARITAISDFFDAITTKRSYHEVLSTEDALAVMEKSVGKKLDPKLFKIFAENVNKLALKGKTHRELPEDFDPCQPQNTLPFKAVVATKKDHNLFEKDNNYGKVVKDDKKKKAS